jgi:hypothetical protein
MSNSCYKQKKILTEQVLKRNTKRARMGVCETKNLYTDLYANICNYRHKRIWLIPYVAPEGIMAIKYESLQLQELNQYCGMLKGKKGTHKR